MTGLKLSAGSAHAQRDASVVSSATGSGITHTTRPIVTGSSVIAMRCADGVVAAADTLGSYGSLARFRGVTRFHKATDTSLLAVGGDLSDFDQIKMYVEENASADYCADDGHAMTPKALHQYLARVMYNRRNKMDPLWNRIAVAGFHADAPFLGLVDLVGTHFEAEVVATGFGEHLGLPLLRKAYRPDITVEEAKKVIVDIMKVLFYRDARSLDRIQVATVTAAGVDISEPFQLETEWSYKAFVHGARGGDVSTW